MKLETNFIVSMYRWSKVLKYRTRNYTQIHTYKFTPNCNKFERNGYRFRELLNINFQRDMLVNVASTRYLCCYSNELARFFFLLIYFLLFVGSFPPFQINNDFDLEAGIFDIRLKLTPTIRCVYVNVPVHQYAYF